MIPKSGVAAWRYSTTKRAHRRCAGTSITGTIRQSTRRPGVRSTAPSGRTATALRPSFPEPRKLARVYSPAFACWLDTRAMQRLVEPLKARLDAQDDAVRDAAATGLGLLGNRDGRARLEAIIARPDPSDAAAKFEADQRKAEAKRALNLIR